MEPSARAAAASGTIREAGYVFEFDAEAAAPEVIGDEEWRDVVLD